MKRTIFGLIATIALICTAPGFAAEEWPGVKFAEVRAYAWPDDGKHVEEDVILKDMALKEGVINKDGAELSTEQVKTLLAAVTGKHPEYGVAACYMPHNAFVFYDADKKPVAFVEICFDCRGLRVMPNGATKPVDLVALATIFKELKLPTGSKSELPAAK